MNERAFLAQVESAEPDELIQILRRPTLEEHRVLELYFGAERLARLRQTALATRRGPKRGNVVVLHGIMGGELTVHPAAGKNQLIWVHVGRLALGGLGWLRMKPDLKSQFNVEATGILQKYYSETILSLTADQWNVLTFWYDWRLDLAVLADQLHDAINRRFGRDVAVNLVGHSMGGLVARTYIQRHPERWAKGGQLVMLGTPNHGSFAIPQVITGAKFEVRGLAAADLTHNRRDILGILNSFPGSAQMLPSPLVMKSMAPMYRAKTWDRWGVAQPVLDAGRISHERLAGIVDGQRMRYIAGYGFPTYDGVRDWARLDDTDSYTATDAGDGTVPHALGFLSDGGKRIPTYFARCAHGDLARHSDVVAGTLQILAGAKPSLPDKMPATRGLAPLTARLAAQEAREARDVERIRELSRGARRRARRDEDAISAEEIEAAELMVRGFLGTGDGGSANVPSLPTPATPPVAVVPLKKLPPNKIAVRLVLGEIQDEDKIGNAGAVAVGHYRGIAPQYAERALDEAISWIDGAKAEADLIITGYHRRGAIPAELGQNFILPDPRKPGRRVVLAGMGEPGAFREAELTVLAQQLAWMLGHARCPHLATVLIGAGAGNLPPDIALQAWMRGVRRALQDVGAAPGKPSARELKMITFVERDAVNFIHIHETLMKVREAFADQDAAFQIDYRFEEKRIKTIRAKAQDKVAQRAVRQFRKGAQAARRADDPQPTRLTVQLQRDRFEFGALTTEASIPQRDTIIDPKLVDEVNDRLPATVDLAQQADAGHLLGRLLLPRDLREKILSRNLPIVLAVDATTARLHWEMLATEPAAGAMTTPTDRFLGLGYGLTRQLRTQFAPLPESPLSGERPMRVLVVADPAEDQPLPGALEEGEAVAAIFEEYQRETGREVEVVRLFGPAEATRVTVLDRIINQRFDLLHYAGHCFFDKVEPARSGWLFSEGQVLSAWELSRVDRVPRFVFSNACESGITPDRRERRTALLAPSFAEAFFGRGVANFVCTAWPVDDLAALAFARRFYRGLLGLHDPAMGVEPMHAAMREARRELAGLGLGGLTTWGAYQHYGDPFFRIQAPGTRSTPPPPRSKPRTRRRK